MSQLADRLGLRGRPSTGCCRRCRPTASSSRTATPTSTSSAPGCCTSATPTSTSTSCARARSSTPSGSPPARRPRSASACSTAASVVVVHHVFRPDATLQMLEVGAQLPAHASALGKAMLAYAPDAVLDDLTAEPLPKLTERTLTAARCARSSRPSARAASPASATRRSSASPASPRRSSTPPAMPSARSAWSATPSGSCPAGPRGAWSGGHRGGQRHLAGARRALVAGPSVLGDWTAPAHAAASPLMRVDTCARPVVASPKSIRHCRIAISPHHPEEEEVEPEHSLGQRAVAETLGTALLVLVGPGSVVATLVLAGDAKPAITGADLLGISFAFGFIITALVYALGKVSGCHINPAVTFALATTKRFPWREVPTYWAAQVRRRRARRARHLGDVHPDRHRPRAWARPRSTRTRRRGARRSSPRASARSCSCSRSSGSSIALARRLRRHRHRRRRGRDHHGRRPASPARR